MCHWKLKVHAEQNYLKKTLLGRVTEEVVKNHLKGLIAALNQELTWTGSAGTSVCAFVEGTIRWWVASRTSPKITFCIGLTTCFTCILAMIVPPPFRIIFIVSKLKFNLIIYGISMEDRDKIAQGKRETKIEFHYFAKYAIFLIKRYNN